MEECATEMKAGIIWEDFLKKSSIQKRENNEEWLVQYETSSFKIRFESFVMYPRSLQGLSVFKVKKLIKPDKDWDYYWDIHVKADCRYDWPNEEVLRVVWCHLDRTKGDYCKLYEYDKLDKSRPEDAMGEPKNMGNGIQRWKLRPHLTSIAEEYLYLTSDGRRSDVILIDTINGYEWEVSETYQRFGSQQRAEKEALKQLLPCKS